MIRLLLAALAISAAFAPSTARAQPGNGPRDHIDPTRLLGAKQFRFDRAFITDAPGLTFSFSRPIPTLDLSKGDGLDPVPVAADQPRYERPTAIAGAPIIETVRHVPGSSIQLLGSGLDHDGVTPLLVVLENVSGPQAPHYLDIFNVADNALLTAEATGAGRNRIVLPGSFDLLRGAVPTKAYRPTAATVCHGLIVIYCTVTRQPAVGQPYDDVGGAFVVSQNRGHTWSIAYESPEFAPGWDRGAPWSMQNWWPTARGIKPKQAYFVATDYCLNPGSPGGHTFMFRATRPKPGAPWTTEPGRILYETTAVEHHHTGGVVPFASPSGDGFRAFSVIGDVRRRNRIVSFARPDANYLSNTNWTVQEDFHGAAASGSFPGTEGNQFVGCAPGPRPNTVLAGSDLTSEQIMLLSFDNNAISHPVTTRKYGFITSGGSGNFNFIIRTPTPELGGPYCANFTSSTPSAPALGRRTLFSNDGEHWAQATASGNGYPCIHGGHIYYDGALGDDFTRSAVPPVHVARPLLIGPGAWQRLRPDARMTSGGNRMVALSKDPAGRWLDNGVPLNPQPPTFGAVYKLTTTIQPSSPIGYIYPTSAGFTTARRFWSQLQARWWIMNPDPSRTASINVGVGFAPASPETYRLSPVSAVRQWTPVDLMFFSFPEGSNETYFVLQPAGAMCDEQVIYVATDVVAEGRGYPGYALPSWNTPFPAPPAHAGLPCPDELASIRSFNCTRDWTITLATQLPENGIDYQTIEQQRWTIATLWGDDQNFIELVADTARSAVVAEVTANGVRSSTLTSDPVLLVRGSPILVSIAHRSADGHLEMTISAGAQSINTHAVTPPQTGRLNAMPREIRFWQPNAAPTSSGIAARVTPLQVWGGQIDERQYLSEDARTLLLGRIEFLAPKK